MNIPLTLGLPKRTWDAFTQTMLGVDFGVVVEMVGPGIPPHKAGAKTRSAPAPPLPRSQYPLIDVSKLLRLPSTRAKQRFCWVVLMADTVGVVLPLNDDRLTASFGRPEYSVCCA